MRLRTLAAADGTVRELFRDPEKQRDFLWRHHRDVPGVGEIVIFNRSHYEAVLIEYVHGWIDKEERKRSSEQLVLALRPEVSCLYLSGYAADVLLRVGGAIDPRHFLQKPFSLTDLAKKIRDVLDKA